MLKKTTLITLCSTLIFSVGAQTLTLDLAKCIEIASDSSLQAFRSKNMYLASYWEYRSYKAARLPSVELRMTPVQYNKNIIKRYDYNVNVDIYRSQQSLYSSETLSIAQNLDLTGGTFFVDSELSYAKNYGESNYSQFSSVPIRIGYSQSLFGFNGFKWEKKIEPLKFETAKKQFLYHVEEIAEYTVQHFFNLVLAEEEYNMAKENVLSADTLFAIGLERDRISTISLADISTLELDLLNARNTLKNAELSLMVAKETLITFLNLEAKTQIDINIPKKHKNIHIPIDEALKYTQENNPDYMANRQEILEAEREVDRTKKSSSFNASVSASLGFNQVANKFSDAYRRPLQQEMITVGLTIPILDWGVKKGKVNMAKNNLDVIKISVQQKEQGLEQDIIVTIENFNIQQEMIISSQRALELANSAHNNTKQRFVIGKSDINSLTLSLNRQKEAQRNHLTILKNYWSSYYKIRKLTLFDFEKRERLAALFDEKTIYNR